MALYKIARILGSNSAKTTNTVSFILGDLLIRIFISTYLKFYKKIKIECITYNDPY